MGVSQLNRFVRSGDVLYYNVERAKGETEQRLSGLNSNKDL